ncbi:ATP-binding response regulator [Glaciimonas soli]|uniref:histidine kinase n=1 Tax=Glaciimonas soli TaxID=2590999 RepID=A0A843YZJ0_9BURK|nr:hybrid sensor histidine kinase/response regulator [Glaciimonas soli]MQR02642.1 response regulator [Glaciimonas soli]
MPFSKNFSLHFSLNQKILISVVSVTFIMFSMVSALTAFHERNRMFSAANDDASNAVKENASVIARGLWEFDKATLTAALKGMTLTSTIVRAEVVDNDKVVAQYSRDAGKGVADRVWSVDLMSPDDEKKIGALRITQSYDDLRDVMTDNMIAVIMSELIKIGVLAAILFIIMHQLLTRHLKSIAHAIESSNNQQQNAITPIALDRRDRSKDELDILVDAINRYRQERSIAEEELRQDIAVRMRIESALQESEASLSYALKIARLGYWEYSIERDEFTFNDQYYSLHRTDAHQIGGYHMSLSKFAGLLLHPEDAESVLQMLQQAISTTDNRYLSQIETRIVCTDNQIRWVLIRFKNEWHASGKVLKLFGANQDITDRKIAEQQTVLLARLSAQKEAAEIANRAKSRFLAAASHDLRQPIHALHLFLGTLKNLELPIQAQRPLANVLRCTESIDEMFVSLLDVAKFDAGLIAPQISDFPVMTVLNRIRHECAPQASFKGVQLQVVPSSAWIKSDPLMVERILRNLVTNAIRYTSTGRILVGCRRRADHKLELAVYDTGVGIAQDQQEKIFDEFYKADIADLNQAGLGLGLSIVDQLSKLLSAPLRLASSEGKGSMFSVTFTLSQLINVDHLSIQPLNNHVDFQGCTILLIDDDAFILEATRGLLEQWGCIVIMAEDIKTAIQLLMQAPTLPNAMICDYRLRGKENGADAVTQIWEEFNTNIPALLITADTSPKRITQLKSTGLPVLHKPIRDDELKEALARLLFPREAKNDGSEIELSLNRAENDD